MTVILALYTNCRGFGYVCLKTPNQLLDFGIVSIRPLDNQKILVRIKKFMDYFKPNIVVVRDANRVHTSRLGQLVNEITEQAVERGIPVYQYSRQQIKEQFQKVGASTKEEIADHLIKWITELEERRPKPRKPWMPEDYNMGIFDALALAVTYYNNS